MIKQSFNVVLVIPVGPGTSVNFVADTLTSFIHFTRTTYKIILADDSQQGIGIMLQQLFPDTDVITTVKAMGGWAGLYVTLSLAFRHAVEQYRFKAVIKLDTDALVIGDAPEAVAIELFQTQPQVGVAGQYPNDYHGKSWNVNWPKQRIINSTRTWKFFRRPIANWKLIKLYNQALQNGYRTGESVFGGAYCMSESFLQTLYQQGLLPNYTFQSLNLGEDHLFALLAKATGFELGDLSSGNLPFGCAWKGLPVSPEQLINDGKKIIHSVRYWQNMNEQDVRTYFKSKRQEAIAQTGLVV